MSTERAAAGSRVSTRWKIVGWIVLTTALALLAVTVTTRSVFVTEVAESANASVVQEIGEFRTFAAEGVDPTTARPFTSMDAMIERYLSRQTPESGEALIGVAGTEAASAPVQYLDNVGGGVGADLARDPVRLQELLDSEADSGIIELEDGELRWGKATAVSAADPQRTGTLIVALSTAPGLAEVERSSLVLFGVAAGGLLLTAGIAYLVAGRILKPLRDMREVTSHITAADLTARVDVQGDDEIAALGHTLNDMLDRVQHAQDAQQAFAVRAQRHLAAPRERVRQAVDVLVDDAATPAQRDAAAGAAQRQLESMDRTVDALATLAAQHSPTFLRPRQVLMSDLAARAHSAAVRVRPERTWELVEGTARAAWLDPDRVVEAVRQLAENAADHTSGDAPIRLGVDEHLDGERPMVSIWVSNRGRTLEPEEAEQLFGAFQSDPAEGAGMGFGLAVVRAVADAHLGSAWVESGPERDTRFGLDLPAEHFRPARSSAQDFEHDVVESLREES